MHKIQKNHKKLGNLIVLSENEVAIELDDRPRGYKICFKEKHHHTTCNPHHHKDDLDYCLKVVKYNFHEKYFLVLKWKVSDIREILWAVYY